MHLKLSRVIIIITFVVIILTLVYINFSAQKQTKDIYSVLNSETIRFNSLVQSLTPEKKAVLFCDETNPDCQYIMINMIKILLNDANVSKFDNIYLVDTKDMDYGILPSSLKAAYGFSHIPAFVVLNYDNSRINYYSVLEWNSSKPFAIEDLKQWMKENKLWLSTYTN
jgi:hypothetical protein